MSKNYSKSGVSRLHYSNHGELFAAALVSNLRQSSFADVKIICADGSVWAHRVVLAAVSPVLRYVLISSDIFVFKKMTLLSLKLRQKDLWIQRLLYPRTFGSEDL